MTDLGNTIEPKSDQLNADDLIQGPMTIKITSVTGNEGKPEQPISIHFEGDHGKPYLPGKSMRRVLVQVWGRDGAAYVGRYLTIYRDPAVRFGGFEVGGIRISHMSDIDTAVTMALTATRASRKPFTVKPLIVEASKPETVEKPDDAGIASYRATLTETISTADNASMLGTWFNSAEQKAARKALNMPKPMYDEMVALVKSKIDQLKLANSGDNGETT